MAKIMCDSSGGRRITRGWTISLLKSTPVLRFKHDNSAIRGVEIVNLLEEVDKLPKAPLEDE